MNRIRAENLVKAHRKIRTLKRSVAEYRKKLQKDLLDGEEEIDMSEELKQKLVGKSGESAATE